MGLKRCYFEGEAENNEAISFNGTIMTKTPSRTKKQRLLTASMDRVS